MSKFFGDHYSDSSETESSSDESDDIKPSYARKAKPQFLEDSESEDEAKREVRSHRDKRFHELSIVEKNLRNHKKIKDMSNVLADFDELTKKFDKSKKIVEAEGVPKFYVRTIAELEDFVNEVWEDKETRKQMNKIQAKSLTALRQKVRKYNKDFETSINEYRENPDAFKDDEGQGEDEEVIKDDEVGGSDAAAAGVGTRDDDEESESDSDEWGSDSDESSSSSSSDEDYGGNKAAKFLKKPGKDEEREKKREQKLALKEKRREEEKRRIKAKARGSDDEDGAAWETVEGKGVVKTKLKLFEKKEEINVTSLLKKLDEVKKGRGRRGTDRSEMILLLRELEKIIIDHGFGAGLKAKICFDIVAAIFDYNPSMASSMREELWTQLLEYMGKLLTILEQNMDTMAVGVNVQEDSECLDKPPYRLSGCILTQCERMDSEFTKILQNSDAHSTSYVERLRDEQQVCTLIDRLLLYLEKKKCTSQETCRAYSLKIEHLYYKFDTEWAKKVATSDDPHKEEITSNAEMNQLCQYIYQGDQQRERTRAILYHIYFLSLHDYWFKARDLMLMSNLQINIEHSDISTMIQYNRAMVQLGLCAFRKGQLKDAHMALVDIQSSGRAKELLAQGLLPARVERTQEQEKLERRRQMPYHMHINLELLECVYLVSAMLLEIPTIAQHENDQKRHHISKNFHHVLKIAERNPVSGPPESMREHIVTAAKAMRQGKWKETRDFILNDKMNNKVWNLFFQSEKVKEMLVTKIKEESLRTYLFTYAAIYDTLSLPLLAEQFELPLSQVHSLISRMILHDEISASLDEPTRCLVMHKLEPSRLQQLSLQLTERLSSLIDVNEKIAETKNISITSTGLRQGQMSYGGSGQQNQQYRARNLRYQQGGSSTGQTGAGRQQQDGVRTY